jgi:hypothetical protein
MTLTFTSKGGMRFPSLGIVANPTDALEPSTQSANTLSEMKAAIFLMIAAIEQAGLPALRVAFTFAVIVFLCGGIFIFRRRHKLFDRDPDVDNDVPVVRHNREELVTFVWSGMTLVLIAILYQVWSA